MANDTSLIIPVAAAAFVQPFRLQYLHRPGVTMPPHITVRSPFKPLCELTKEAYDTLDTLFASFSPFAFTLGRLARFAETDVLYLAPEPVEPFMAMYQAIYARYPEPPENHSSVIFHLTLARRQPSDLDRWEEEFHRMYGTQLPIQAMTTEVSLYEEREERWFKIASFPLGKSSVT